MHASRFQFRSARAWTTIRCSATTQSLAASEQEVQVLKAANEAAEDRVAAALAELRASRPDCTKELDGLSAELAIAHEVCFAK